MSGEIGASAAEVGRALGDAMSAFGRATKKIASAHYGLLGRYTMPLQKPEETPTPCRDLNTGGMIAAQVILFPIPVFSWVASATVFPLVGNGAISFVRAAKRVVSLPLLTSSLALEFNRDERNIPQKIYGIPGYILGVAVGLPASLAVAIGRVFADGAVSGKRLFVSMTNFWVHADDKFKWKGLNEDDDRHPVGKYGFGAFGLGIGFVLGLVSMTFVGLIRIITNTFKTMGRVIATLVNFVVPEDRRSDPWENDNREPHQKFGLGFLGLIIGGVIGSVAAWVANVWKTSVAVMVSMLKGVLPQENAEAWEAESYADDKRHWCAKGIVGSLGFIIGGALGLVSSTVIGIGRVISNSWKTGFRVIATLTNFVIRKEERPTEWVLRWQRDENDDRSKPEKFILGSLGLIIGTAIGSITALIANVWKTSVAVMVSMIKCALPKDMEDEWQAESFSKDKRHWLPKSIVGAPGFLIGGLLGVVTSLSVSFWRVLWNSFEYGGSMIKYLARSSYHFASQTEDLPKTEGKPWNVFGFGLPGLVVGSLIGSVVAGFVMLGHFFKKNIEALSIAYCKTMNVVLPESKQMASPYSSNWKQLIGVMGGIVGLVSGVICSMAVVVGRIVANSFSSGGKMIQFLVSSAYHDKLQHEHLPKGEGKPWIPFGFGFPGLVMGSIIGAIAAGFVYIGHFFKKNWEALSTVFVKTLNVTLPESHQIETPHKLTLKHLAGVIGGALGFVTGMVCNFAVVIGRIVANSFSTGGKMIQYLVKSAFHAASQPEELPKSEGKPWVAFGFGFPGLVIGSIIGAIAAGFVMVGHFFKKNWEALSKVFVKTLNVTLPESHQIETPHKLTLKHLAGVIGGVLGFVTGMVCNFAVVIGRIVANSFSSGGKMIHYFAKSAFHVYSATEVLPSGEDKPWVPFGFGAPGLVIGSVIGLMTAGFIYVGHFFKNVGMTAAATWSISWEFLFKRRNDNDPMRYADDWDRRESRLQKHLLGGLGHLFVLPFIALNAVIATFAHSALTAFQIARNIINKAKHPLTQKEYPPSIRFNYQIYGFGVLGVPFGVVIGAVGFASVLVARFIGHCALTLKSTIVSMVRFALSAPSDPEADIKDLKTDPRNWVAKYIVGGPGLLIGGFIGIFPTMAVMFGRMCKESFETAKRLFVTIINPFLHDENKMKCQGLEGEDDERSRFLKYGAGAPGLLFGFIASIAALPFVASGRWFTNTIKSGVSTFWTFINPLIRMNKRHDPNFNAENLYPGLVEDKRALGLKLLGFIGIAVGGLVGFVAAGSLVILGALRETWNSWKALSGSLMNLATNRQKFYGLKGEEDRAKFKKAMGGLGYFLAVMTTGPLSMLILVGRKMPIILGMTASVLFSWLVAPIKGFAKLAKGHRFAFEHPNQEMVQSFKNLYSSLSSTGLFKTNKLIVDNGTGKKGPLSFVRKAFTFSVKTSTERMLDTLLQKCREQGIEFLDTDAFNQAVLEVESIYKKGLFMNQAQVNAAKEEVRDVAEFIRDYLKTGKEEVPQDLYTKFRGVMTWKETFMGKARPVVPDFVPLNDHVTAPAM